MDMNQTLKNALIWILLLAVIVLGYLLTRKAKVDVPVADLPLESGDIPDDREEGSDISEEVARDEEINEENDVYKINAVYPVFGNSTIDEEIKSFIQKEVSTFKSENSESFPGQVAKYSFGSHYRIVKSDREVSIIFNIETYSGGAHGNLFIRTFVYKKNSERLSIGSFFTPGSKYLEKISELAKQKLGQVSDEDWYDEGTAPVSSYFDAFYISPEGNLNIIFQPYQVGPWVAGTPEVSIGFDELGDIVNEDYR